MESRLRKITKALIVGSYLGSILGNAVAHCYEAFDANRESKKPFYGEDMRKEWSDYSSSQLRGLISPRMLIPFSASRENRPIEFRVVGFEDSGIQVKLGN